jgi:hypothetical protein
VLTLLAFGGLVLFYAGALAPGRDSPGRRRAGLVLLVVALFVHPEATLLLPAVALAAVFLNGPRWWLGRGRWAELLLAFGAAAGRYALQLVLAQGAIGGFETVAGSRPPVELGGRLLANAAEIVPFFTASGRWLWSVLALVGLGLAVWQWRAGRRDGPVRATLTFSACLWLVPLGMILFLGSTYQSPRYLTFLLPVMALCAAAGLWLGMRYWIDEAVWDRRATVAAALLGLALLASYLPGAVAAAGYREKGYEEAFARVSEAWQVGDRVATVAPASCALLLDRCDYFALGIDYEEFVYRSEDGQLVDRWLSSPLVRTAEELSRLLDQEWRLWLVVDEGRLRRRFEPEFARLAWARMELVAKRDGVFVFRSRAEDPPGVSGRLNAQVGPVELVGYSLPGQGADHAAPDLPGRTGWGEVVAQPGQALPLVLDWQALSYGSREAVVFVHLVDWDDTRHAQDDGPPLGGLQPMTHWVPGEVLPDRHVLALPPDLPPGRYQILVGMYDAETGDRLPARAEEPGRVRGDAVILDYVRVLDPEEAALPTPQVAVDTVFAGAGDEIRLIGYDLVADKVAAGKGLQLTLYWQAEKPVGDVYSYFVHLLDAEGEIRSQRDGVPLEGYYPTTLWDPGELVADGISMRVEPDTLPGTYRLAVGLYILDPPRRLETPEGDRLVIAEVAVR